MKRLKLEPFPQPAPIILNNPVLLCHGFGAMGNMGKKGLLHDIGMMYRMRGILAFAPNIVPYGRIETRAEAWKTAMEEIRRQTGNQPLDVIAHSMGGLDIRYAIHHLGAHAYINRLVTVSTPHRGTYLADFMLRTPDTVLKHLADLTNWFGNSVHPDTPSDVLGALEQLTREYVEHRFNPDCPDHPEVEYYSVTASAGEGTGVSISPLLIPFNKRIYEQQGVNDGYIPVSSAVWGRVIGETQLSHPEQIKINLTSKKLDEWEHFWLDIARYLAGE